MKIKAKKVMYFKTLNKTYHRLLKVLPVSYHQITLNIGIQDLLDYELTKGAMAPTYTITIGTKVLAKFRNDTYVLLMLLAHELGHHVLGHCHTYSGTKEEEWAADHFGLYLATQAGYDPLKYIDAEKRFEKWRANGIQKSHKQSHGTANQRFDNLNKQLQYIGTSTGR
jgi:hypothetical protein